MSIWRATIENELPRLRRFVYCITGSRESADDILEAFLIGLDAGSAPVDGLPLRLGLYKALQPEIAAFDETSGGASDAVRIHRQLLSLPMLKRQAVVLRLILRFGAKEASLILGYSEKTVQSALVSGLQAVRDLNGLRALIIGNRADKGQELDAILRSIGIRTYGQVSDDREALRLAHELNPSLILTDAPYRNGDGNAEVVKEIRRDLSPHLVYIRPRAAVVPHPAEAQQAPTVGQPFDSRTVARRVAQALEK